MAKVYPKQWNWNLTYLKSPNSNVVHICYKPITEDETFTAQPICGVWCWKYVTPVLQEDLENGHFRLCKNCCTYIEKPWWHQHFAERNDFLRMKHC